jgi:hypothetical protein
MNAAKTAAELLTELNLKHHFLDRPQFAAVRPNFFQSVVCTALFVCGVALTVAAAALLH